MKIEGHSMCQNLFTRKSLGLLYTVKYVTFCKKWQVIIVNKIKSYIIKSNGTFWQSSGLLGYVPCPSYLVFPFENEISKIDILRFLNSILHIYFDLDCGDIKICRKLHFLNFIIFMFI